MLIEELERRRIGDETLELIEGEVFLSPRVTPYLAEVIRTLAQSIRQAIARRGGPRPPTVAVEPWLPIGARTLLVPDLALGAVGEFGVLEEPRLVVEVRTESTDRYALGPKRVMYARARIPEYWFVDPRAGCVRTMRLAGDALDYEWPPTDVPTEGNAALLLPYEPGASVLARDLSA